ncbi:MAG: hypothetical protein KDD45_06240 [Bdellovibrionales bacterium]|nr:hypothetical protein [Bdellovibrionales bacterium]
MSILMIDKGQLEQQSFVGYLNILQENRHKVHPRYIEPIQSTNNIYVVLERVRKVEEAHLDYR